MHVFGGGLNACVSEILLCKHITSVQLFLIFCTYLRLVISFMGLHTQLEKANV